MMTEHYITLFDSNFLPQGLALHRSMERHAGPYQLWVLCMDEAVHDVLSRLGLPHVRLLRLSDCETPELAAVRPNRSRAEYCWTVKPFAPTYVFDADDTVARVTYLDADLWFRGRPTEIFDEFEASGKAALITEHAYSPEDDESATAGRYCAGFFTLVRNRGEQPRRWWEQKCLEWCHARVENGKFGDQKYLESWPLLFHADVHVLRRHEAMLGPWNARRFPLGSCLIYHFHGLRLLPRKRVSLATGKRLPRIVRQQIYHPYLADFQEALQAIEATGFCPPAQISLTRHMRMWARFLAIECWRITSRLLSPGIAAID